MHILVRQLEITLGPDTAELGLRFGLHSGPVTAGVLRGERARFQLFGDAMNTTARVETTGAKNKIHISQETADLLILGGKGHWVRARDDKVHAKGKGELTTYWLAVKDDLSRVSPASSENGNDIDFVPSSMEFETDQEKVGNEEVNPGIDNKTMRLVDWHTDIISKLLKEIVIRREAVGARSDSIYALRKLEKRSLERESIIIDDCADVIELPVFSSVPGGQSPAKSVNLADSVTNQLHDYIKLIAAT